MIRLTGPAAALFAVAIALQSSKAEPLSEALTRFETVAIKSSRSVFGGKGDSMATVSLLTRLRAAVEAQRWQEAIQLVFQIEYKNQDAEVVKLCGPLLDSLRKERVAKEEAAAVEMKAAVKKAGEILLSAKDPKELDQVLADLTPLMQVSRTEDTVNESEELRRARIEVGTAQKYVRVWQECLQKRAAGDETAAVEKMQSLAGPDFFPIVPRSALLAKSVSSQTFQPFQAEPVIKEIFSGVKSLDELGDAFNALQNWQHEQPRSAEFKAAAERITALRTAYGAYRAGQYSEAFGFFTRRSNTDVDLDDQMSILRKEFLLKVLPHYLGSPEITATGAEEFPSDYLLRLAREAAQQRKWPLAMRAMEAFRTISFGNGATPSWISADIAGFAAIAKAERQENAGQFADAVASYRAALECSSQNVPVDIIGQRLVALRKNHPEAFALNQLPRGPQGSEPARQY